MTGASSGIGLELAREFAKHGFDLVVAADGDDIHRVAEELDAEAVQADLSTPEGVGALHAQVRHRQVTALALNAGITARSDDLDRELELVDLNCRSLVHLARLLTAEMAAAGRGRVLDHRLDRRRLPRPAPGGLQREQGVRAVVRDRSPARAARARRERDRARARPDRHADLRQGRSGDHAARRRQLPKDSPTDVAQQAFEALMAGRETVVAASITSKATHLVSRVLPDPIAARLTALVTKPR